MKYVYWPLQICEILTSIFPSTPTVSSQGKILNFSLVLSALQSSMSLKSSWNSIPPLTWPGTNIYKVFHIPSTGRWRGKIDYKFWCTLSPSKLQGFNINTNPFYAFIRKMSALETCRSTDGHFLPLEKVQPHIQLVLMSHTSPFHLHPAVTSSPGCHFNCLFI